MSQETSSLRIAAKQMAPPRSRVLPVHDASKNSCNQLAAKTERFLGKRRVQQKSLWQKIQFPCTRKEQCMETPGQYFFPNINHVISNSMQFSLLKHDLNTRCGRKLVTMIFYLPRFIFFFFANVNVISIKILGQLHIDGDVAPTFVSSTGSL